MHATSAIDLRANVDLWGSKVEHKHLPGHRPERPEHHFGVQGGDRAGQGARLGRGCMLCHPRMPSVTGTAASDCSGSCRLTSRTSAAPYLCRKGIDEHERRDEGDRGTTVSTRGSGGLRGGPLKDGCEMPQGLVGKGLGTHSGSAGGGDAGGGAGAAPNKG